MEQNPQLLPPEQFRAMVPNGILDTQRTKGKAPPNQGFAYRLWHLLNWVDNDLTKATNLGARWISPKEFILDKQRYGQIVGLQQNTLNFKLRTCKFTQSRPRHLSSTFWKCEGFTKDSTIQEIEAVDNRRDVNENSPQVTSQAVYLPLLEQVRIFTQQPGDMNHFKSEAIFLWDDIVQGNSIWAYPFSKFIEEATVKFCTSYTKSSTGDTFAFDAQQTQFSQYLKNYNLNLNETAKKMLTYVITHKNQYFISMPEFCTFFARFGPEDSVLEKIHQLLCCSKTFNDWFKPGEQLFDQHKAITGSYSNTFANCFIIKRSQGATYHVYNHPFYQTRTGFLLDETGKVFMTWHAVFESLSLAQQPVQFPNYQSFEPMFD